jgi:ABC-type multidrug transport system fused ATPase/permease subunit
VLHDDQDVRQATPGAVRHHVALLLDHGQMRSGTVSANLRPDDGGEVSMEQVVAAAKTVCADDFIARLPQGYDTVLGEHGATLAPHERFQLSAARLLLRRPAAVVIDEPSESHAPAADAATDRALRAVAAERTAVILANRLGTLRTAERVVVIHEGRVIGDGTHAELLQQSDLYRHLVYLRFNEFRRPQAQRGDASSR